MADYMNKQWMEKDHKIYNKIMFFYDTFIDKITYFPSFYFLWASKILLEIYWILITIFLEKSIFMIYEFL